MERDRALESLDWAEYGKKSFNCVTPILQRKHPNS